MFCSGFVSRPEPDASKVSYGWEADSEPEASDRPLRAESGHSLGIGNTTRSHVVPREDHGFTISLFSINVAFHR